MSGVYDFAVYAPIAGTVAAAYKANTGSPLGLVQSATNPAKSSPHTQVLAFNSTFRCSRVEWYSGGPFGTLIAADDLSYADWTAAAAGGWTQVTGAFGGVTWTGSEVQIADASSTVCYGIYRATPSGADACVVKGAWFNDAETSLHWGMVSLHANGPDNLLGSSGYRVLIRDAHPHNVELVDAGAPAPEPTPMVAGWTVGWLG